MIITNAQVFIDGQFHDVDVQYDENKIINIGRNLTENVADKDIIDAKGNYLFAGFIETHQHGGFRKTFYRNEYSENAENFNGLDDVNFILKELPKYGVTTVFPTLDVQPIEDTVEALRAIRKAREQGLGADPMMIHFEGPYLNPKRSACLDPNLCVLPSKEHTMMLVDNDLSDIAIMCLAPELEGAEQWCRWITGQGVHVEIGYTLCDSEMVKKAADWGADTTTHFFNGFEAMHHRKDGAIVGCLLEDRLTFQIICDGYHVNKQWIKLAIKTKGTDKIYGITDEFNFSGLEDGEYDNDFYGKISVSDGLVAVKETGMILGGNNTWDKMMRRARDVIGLNEIEIAKIYGENPARCLKIKDRGKIEIGRRSDFCLMDKDYNVLKTIIKGKVYYER
ncbi:MAG TPA: amidohydrolase family protein [Erysipelotrichaceae bacterium]|nr:amidohydrolase family protein [Erysipelotrichaceae bacterium]